MDDTRAYYSEIDPYAAEWLRNLIAAGVIANGDVDERSIVDVQPNDLRGYTQCHFFAGIGTWSHVLRRAGWHDDRHVWTGSCPCQPFSAAGKGDGFDDERHLWPAFFHLIEQCRPSVVLGEQVASKDGLAWIDLVQSDMEGANYPFGALDLCAAGFGAPHIRQRLYWMADANQLAGGQGRADIGGFVKGSDAQSRPGPWLYRSAGILGDGERTGLERHGRDGDRATRWPIAGRSVAAAGATHSMDNTISDGRRARRNNHIEHERIIIDATGINDRPGPTNGYWRAADWLLCRDDKWRPVEPGTFPLAHGATSRVGRLRAYGNAIVAAQAQEFVTATMATIDAMPVRLSGDALRQDQA